MKKGCTLVGVRPTGRLHVGHYLSVVQPALEGADVLIATYHGGERSMELARALSLLGVDTGRVFRQDETFDAPLYFRLLRLARAGELSRMTQYKSCTAPDASMFVYPVLMAHDVVGYETICVGDDQRQHLEFARTLIARHNREHATAHPLPLSAFTGRVMDLRDPSRKMSKSCPSGCLFLDDDPGTVRVKLRAAVTDVAGRKNLEFLCSRFGVEPSESNEQTKDGLADALVRRFSALTGAVSTG